MTMPEAAESRPRPRTPIDRIGVTVLKELVTAIVTGEYAAGALLPNESELSAQFGVSRTVVRETMKRLQEKGMVTVAQGRGTHATPSTSWNVLDPLVLSTMIGNDSTLGVLDDLSVVRGALEAAMAAAAAERADDEQREHLREALDAMAAKVDDSEAFREADLLFHRAIMDLSGNDLAQNIAGALIRHAVGSDRFTGVDPEHAFELTLSEHERILEAILAGDAESARIAMSEHILGSWERRRLPSPRRAH